MDRTSSFGIVRTYSKLQPISVAKATPASTKPVLKAPHVALTPQAQISTLPLPSPVIVMPINHLVQTVTVETTPNEPQNNEPILNDSKLKWSKPKRTRRKATVSKPEKKTKPSHDMSISKVILSSGMVADCLVITPSVATKRNPPTHVVKPTTTHLPFENAHDRIPGHIRPIWTRRSIPNPIISINKPIFSIDKNCPTNRPIEVKSKSEIRNDSFELPDVTNYEVITYAKSAAKNPLPTNWTAKVSSQSDNKVEKKLAQYSSGLRQSTRTYNRKSADDKLKQTVNKTSLTKTPNKNSKVRSKQSYQDVIVKTEPEDESIIEEVITNEPIMEPIYCDTIVATHGPVNTYGLRSSSKKPEVDIKSNSKQNKANKRNSTNNKTDRNMNELSKKFMDNSSICLFSDNIKKSVITYSRKTAKKPNSN